MQTKCAHNLCTNLCNRFTHGAALQNQKKKKKKKKRPKYGGTYVKNFFKSVVFMKFVI